MIKRWTIEVRAPGGVWHRSATSMHCWTRWGARHKAERLNWNLLAIGYGLHYRATRR